MTTEGANYEGLERFKAVDATGEEQMFFAFLDRRTYHRCRRAT
jgi:hypothetical protein